MCTQVNIFEQDLIVIPWYWKHQNHFMCVVIDCCAHSISVYDSMANARRAAAVYKVGLSY